MPVSLWGGYRWCLIWIFCWLFPWIYLENCCWGTLSPSIAILTSNIISNKYHQANVKLRYYAREELNEPFCSKKVELAYIGISYIYLLIIHIRPIILLVWHSPPSPLPLSTPLPPCWASLHEAAGCLPSMTSGSLAPAWWPFWAVPRRFCGRRVRNAHKSRSNISWQFQRDWSQLNSWYMKKLRFGFQLTSIGNNTS